MQYPRVKLRSPKSSDDTGVYADLDELIRLQYKATGFSFLPHQPIHSILAGRHASRLRGRGLNFEELRRYLPGDDIRNMDWKVTARMQKPHVRVYTEERDRPALLVVDQRLSMFFGSTRAMKSVAAAEAAALGAWRIFHVGDRVGALVFDDHDIVEIAPHRSRGRVMQILQAVVEKNHALRADADLTPNSAMLNRALERALRVAKHDYLVCLVTDGFGADAESERLVTLLSEHNDVMTVFIFDPLEAELPDSGRLVMAEGAAQLEVNTSDTGLRRRFHDEFEQRLAHIQDLSRKRSIPVLPIQTGEGVAEQVKTLLGHARSA